MIEYIVIDVLVKAMVVASVMGSEILNFSFILVLSHHSNNIDVGLVLILSNALSRVWLTTIYLFSHENIEFQKEKVVPCNC